MPYRIKESGEKVILSVLIGADSSLIGLRVNHSKIISMKFGELNNIVLKIYGVEETNHFIKSVMNHYRPTTAPGEVLNLCDCDIVVLETICENTSDYFAPDTILKALKLYHGADIYSCYSVNYKFEDGKIRFGGLGDTVQYQHAIGYIEPYYTLTDEQKNGFAEWYGTIYRALNAENRSDNYKAMIRMYETSYLVGLCESEYIMLFSILEMLLGTGNSEITYQISRGTAILLSKSADEMLQIYTQMKKLYNARSMYVHSGKTIDHKNLFELREIVRKVLLKIAELGYHTTEKKFDELKAQILLGGYHSFVNKKEEKTINNFN